MPRFADALAMLLGTEDVHELSGIQASLYSLYSINIKGRYRYFIIMFVMFTVAASLVNSVLYFNVCISSELF